MRTKSAIATFVALGATTAGVRALDTVNATTVTMRGSDTLNGITDRIVQICETNAAPPQIVPTGSIVYDGTGSGNGQTALTNTAILTVTGGAITETPVQTVAPMSRSMNAAVCASAVAPNSTAGGAFDVRGEAEGLAFALDGLSIIASGTATVAAGCNAAPGADICATSPTGVRFSGTVGGEVINDWREVLRILYAGLPNGAANAARDCNSAARQALAASWDEIFQGDCPSCDDPVLPNQVRHVLRRDEESGTTDVFLSLLLLPTTNFNQGTAGTYDRQIANSHFCNVKRATDTYGIPVSAQPHTTPATWDDPGQAGVPVAAPYFPEFQDMDPIRRDCVGNNNLAGAEPALVATEQVCGPKGDLGLVLPINPPPQNAAAPNPYPTKYCATGRFRFADAPRNRLGGTTGIFCPNGDLPLGTQCQYPTAADGDFACLNGRNSLPGSRICNNAPTAPAACTTADGVIVGLTPFTTPRAGDGRVYNLHLKSGIDTAGGGAYQMINRPNPSNPIAFTAVRIVSAFYRIHTTRTLHAPFNDGCQQPDATRQLGCLPTKSHCSIAYAGREGVALNPGADGLRLDQIPSETLCVQNLTTGGGNVYPFSRKLYINSLRGFENLNLFGLTAAPTGPIPTFEGAPDNEQELVKCFNQVSTNTAVVEGEFGYVPIPGGAICEDYNEMNLCNTGVLNVNACADNGTPAVVPVNTAFCGDGIVQAPAENCDDANAVNTDACPNDCTNP